MTSFENHDVSIQDQNTLKFYFLEHDTRKKLPIIEPTSSQLSSLEDLASYIDQSHVMLQNYGAILFRGFKLTNMVEFQDIARKLIPKLSDYIFRSSPRSKIINKIYTSTEYPADQTIPLHSENAFTRNIPDRIIFYCDTPPTSDGETPIADNREIYQALPQGLRNKFQDQGIKYIRNYLRGIDLSWQEVFQTDQKSAVEETCIKLSIEFEWKSHDHLQTWQTCEAIGKHPLTHEEVWLNQAHLFHYSLLPDEVAEYLISHLGYENLPRNVVYGNNDPIDPADIKLINNLYREKLFMFQWHKNDMLLLDNQLMAHGRQPFHGKRKIAVAMGNLR